MIVDKHPHSEEEPNGNGPLEPPPSYNEPAYTGPVAATPIYPREKIDWTTYASPSTFTIPQDRPSLASAKAKGKAKAASSSSWFSFAGSSRTTREVKATVLGLVRDLIKQNSTGDHAGGILASCSEACEAYGLKLSTVLQEKSIESHTPIYWTIFKRPAESTHTLDQGSDLVMALLLASTPLLPETISEIRLACILKSDQVLFQRLRQSPVFAPLRGTDEMILGDEHITDGVEVFDVPEDDAAFVVDFSLFAFQARMRVSNAVEAEFIAKGRLWALAFRTAENSRTGSWKITLTLLEHSPPTYIDSRILIPEPIPPPLTTTTQSSPESILPQTLPETFNPSPRSPASTLSTLLSLRPKSKPTIELRLRSYNELVPSGSRHSGRVDADLGDSLMGNSLQFANTAYIRPDGVLRARLEARLARAEADCVLC